MIDCLTSNLAAARKSKVLDQTGVTAANFIYVTLHRPSNVDDKETLTAIFSSLDQLAQQVPVVFPVHPRTRKMLSTFGLISRQSGALRLIEPVGYLDSLTLTENARLIVTDSGGLQEEATYFRTPCLTLRPNTERPITLTIGSNKLTTPNNLVLDAVEILRGPRWRGARPNLWDGRTAERVLVAITNGSCQPLRQFEVTARTSGDPFAQRIARNRSYSGSRRSCWLATAIPSRRARCDALLRFERFSYHVAPAARACAPGINLTVEFLRAAFVAHSSALLYLCGLRCIYSAVGRVSCRLGTRHE